MSNEIDLSGLSDFLKKKASNINGTLEKAIEGCCIKVRDDIQYNMAHTQRDMSKTYYTNNKTKAHHPSLPGNPPAVDSGNLRDSIRYEIHGEGREAYGIVGSSQKDEDYAVWMEYGTSDGRIEKRPWLRPAMIKNNDFIRHQIAKAVKETFMEE